jgi:hypothetical protein
MKTYLPAAAHFIDIVCPSWNALFTGSLVMIFGPNSVMFAAEIHGT